MKKIGLLCLALVLALGTLGIGYATWSDNVTVEETVYSGEMCVHFTSCSTNDPAGQIDDTVGSIGCANTWDVTMCNPGDDTTPNQFVQCDLDKDIGSVNCTRESRDGDLYDEVLVVTVNNTYPSYYGIVNYSVFNCGTIPWTIDTVDVLVDDVVVYTANYSWCKAIDLDGENGPDIEIWWGDNFHEQTHPGQGWDNSFHFHLLQEAPEGEELVFKLRMHVIQWNKDPLLKP